MSRRSRRIKSDNRLPLIIIGFVLVVIILFVFFYVTEAQSAIETDPTTNCRVDKIIPRETVILLDATEAVSQSQLVGLSNQLEKIVQDSIIYERFKVYFLKDDPQRFKPKFSICNPGNGIGLSPFTNNLRKLMNNWEESFRTPMISSIEGLATINSSASSPIMEMLKFVGLRTFSRSSSSEKRLVLVSDMVEHTESYSQYRDRKFDFEKLAVTSYFKEMRPHLNGVHIDLLYLQRAELTDIQRSEHITKFWKPFIKNSGGQINIGETVN